MTPDSGAFRPHDARAVAGSPVSATTAYYQALFAPGTGEIRRIGDFAATGDGQDIFFFGDSFDAAYAAERALYRVGKERSACLLRHGDLKLLRMAPDDRHLAYAVHGEAGDTIEIMEWQTQAVVGRTRLTGGVEDLGWSPDSSQIFALVAGLGADRSGRDGGIMPVSGDQHRPVVSPDLSEDLWRRVWVFAPGGDARRISPPDRTIWEAAWCGNDSIVAIATADPTENAWYDANLVHFDGHGDRVRELYTPRDQIGLPACSADGAMVAFVEAVCSDRGLVCGDLKLLDMASGAVRSLDTGNVDVSSVAFRAHGDIHFAGLRSFETVVGDIGTDGLLSEIWSAKHETCGAWHPLSLPIGRDQCLLLREGPHCPPDLTLLSSQTTRSCFALADIDLSAAIGLDHLSWQAADGTCIDGLLLSPQCGEGPYPCMVDIHGGPILAHRPRWIGNIRLGWLIACGVAIFLPNPRGSCGRGQAFAAAVKGDMGGADATDLLSGVDHLVGAGRADAGRIMLSGSSYGGYMSAWLVTQTDRFRTAIAISPISNWYSQHGTSQIPRFDSLFLADAAQRRDRSPLFHADKAETPTLLLAGARDRNTPPGQAQEFYTALLERGVPTQMVLYPTGGHSLRDLPILIDTAARIDAWIGPWLR